MFARKDFCVKPVALVGLSECGDAAPSRVGSLLRLAAATTSKQFFLAGLDKEGRTTEKLDCLLEYFSRLPVNVQDLVYAVIMKKLNARLEENYLMWTSPVANAADTCFLAWAVFQQHSHTLELSEFIGDSGSRQVFHHIKESPSPNDRIRRLDIGSSEISSEKLSYLFEVTDSVWKPELKLFLDQLVNLTHLVFRYACDDDTMSLVGKQCSRLQFLKLQLAPESIKGPAANRRRI